MSPWNVQSSGVGGPQRTSTSHGRHKDAVVGEVERCQAVDALENNVAALLQWLDLYDQCCCDCCWLQRLCDAVTVSSSDDVHVAILNVLLLLSRTVAIASLSTDACK